MPTTVNGVGTWYYGKANIRSYQGKCEQCGRVTTLTSYDTRLWFILLYIPVIPLGRKHVLDQCSACRRHKVLALDDWHKARDKAIQEAMLEMGKNPGDPAKAIELHKRYVYFWAAAEAEQLLDFMREHFPDDAACQHYLGVVLNFLNRPGEATPHFERARNLEPGNLGYQESLGRQYVCDGRLAEGHEVLRFAESEEPARHTDALAVLAIGYQKTDDHKEALRLLELAAKQQPGLRSDAAFKRLLRASRLALGQGGAWDRVVSVWHWFTFGRVLGAIAVLAVATCIGWSLYTARHRTLHIVSGADAPVKVSIDGQPAVTARPDRAMPVALAEGRHHASMKGGVERELDFVMETGFLERFHRDPVFVLNAGGSAMLTYEETIYASSPTGGGFSRLLYGEDFNAFPNVDYVFVAFPPQLHVSNKAATAMKSRVGLVPAGGLDVCYYQHAQGGAAASLPFAEWYLSVHPDDGEVLYFYCDQALAAKAAPQALAYLHKRCADRPLRLEWHRRYQLVAGMTGDANLLASEYEALLKERPQDPDALYLRGRICLSAREAQGFYDRALALEPKHAFAHRGAAHVCESLGDWLGVKREAEAVAAAKGLPGSAFALDARRLLLHARMALGEWAEAEAAVRKVCEEQKSDLLVALQAALVSAARGKSDEALALCDQYENAARVVAGVTPEARAEVSRAAHWLHATTLYALGRFAESAQVAAKAGAHGDAPLFHAWVEQGQLAEARAALKKDALQDRGYLRLALGVAYGLVGHAREADEMFAEAVSCLDRGDPCEREATRILRAPDADGWSRLQGLHLEADNKAILLAAFAAIRPAHAAEALALARKLHPAREFPYHLLQRLK